MIQSNVITLFYGTLEHEKHDEFCDICADGCPRDVLAWIKASEFDCENLKKKVIMREASPIPVHPWRHPFVMTCHKRNFPIVRLLLELGADPDAAYSYNQTPRQKYGDDPQLLESFNGGRFWWKVEYSEEKKLALLSELEHFILAGEASEAVWLMMHGVRLDSPAILASDTFGKQSRAFKELVCGMGVSNDRLLEFHAWLKENTTDADVLDIMDTLARTNGDEGRKLVEKLLFSIDLIGAERLDSLIDFTLPIPVQISMLQCFISAYDTSEHQAFIEKAIAALFKGMLCACMEV